MSLNLQIPSGKSDAYRAAFSQLQNYLEGQSPDVASMATIITAPVTKPLPGADSIESYLWSLWGATLNVAGQVPHDHSAQQRLVVLLAAIKQVPPPPPSQPNRVKFEQEWTRKLWKDLPVFGALTTERWDLGCWERESEPPPQFERFFRQMPPDQWLNFNGFIAKIVAAGVDDFRTSCIQILRETLEERRRPDSLDKNIPAASVWMLYAGSLIYNHGEPDNSQENWGPPSGEKAIYHGPGGFCRERWDWWKGRFEWTSGMEELQGETRAIAEKAFEAMRRIEAIDENTADGVEPPATRQ